MRSMNEKQRQKLDRDGQVLVENPVVGEITGDLMNMGIDPFKVEMIPGVDGIIVVNNDHKDRPIWRSSKDDAEL